VDRFEIGPTKYVCDAILAFWWIAKYSAPDILRNPHELQFEQCLTCTEASAKEFNLPDDSEIVDYPEAMVLGSISTYDENVDPNLLNSRSGPL
jgi:hypothetical protein